MGVPRASVMECGFLLPLLVCSRMSDEKRQKRQAHSKSSANIEAWAYLAPASWSAASFCRFWFALGCRMKSARKDRRTPKAPPISRHGRTSRQRHGVRLPSAAFGLLSDVGSKAPEKTGALQKLRQYRGMGVPRASVME